MLCGIWVQAEVDGDQVVVLWYQLFWDIVKQILSDTKRRHVAGPGPHCCWCVGGQ